MRSPENRNNEAQEQETRYDAVVVLGAVMEWNSKRKRWDFPSIIERYPGKLVEGKARAIAASEIEAETPLLLVTGGSDKNPETGEVVSRAEELAKLISGRYGVPTEKVVPMGLQKDSHTLGNVENVISYLEEHPTMLRSKEIGILVPRFQCARAKLMFESNPYFQENGITLEWIIVEDVLENRDPRYKKWVERLYSTPQAEINQQMEQRGIKDLQRGKYKPQESQ
mgnify:CR=1 FL=1